MKCGRSGARFVRRGGWLYALAGALGLMAAAVLPAAAPVRHDPPPPAIELTGTTGGTALFTADGLVPGHPVANCLAVRFRDAVPGSTVRLYARVESGELAPYLAVTVRTGSGGAGDDCASFVGTATPFQGRLSGLAAAERRSPVGLPMLRLPDAEGSMTVQMTISVVDNNAAQGRAARFDLVLTAPLLETAGTGRTPPPAAPAAKSDQAATWLREALRTLRRVAAAVGPALLKAGSVGVGMGLLVAVFLLLQNRIDRRDPKLALAPIRPPRPLDFTERSAVP